jgi:hypothetical protein
VNTLVVGAEVLIWRENDINATPALLAIGAVNAVFGAILVAGWARFLGHGSGRQRGQRAILTQEVGAVHFEPEPTFCWTIPASS